jgi:hypothetical protein
MEPENLWSWLQDPAAVPDRYFCKANNKYKVRKMSNLWIPNLELNAHNN